MLNPKEEETRASTENIKGKSEKQWIRNNDVEVDQQEVADNIGDEYIDFDYQQEPESTRTQSYNFLAQNLYNDLAQGQDLLNIGNEVHALAEVLLMRDVKPPLTVGILGSWGSGKSYVMHLMQQRMTEIRAQSLSEEEAWENKNNSNKNKLSPYIGHVYQINFDAWTYARSNLWASLMQNIFLELNRQLTLEQQLIEAGIDPLEGGESWRVLNDVPDEERQALITSLVGKEKWEEVTSKPNLKDQLLKNLENIQQQQEEDLKFKQEKLIKAEESLNMKKKEIKQGITSEVNENAFAPVKELLKEKMGEVVLSQVETEIKKTLQEHNTQIDEGNIKWLSSTIEKLKSTKLVTWSSIQKWAYTNRMGIVAITLFLALSILMPFLLGQLTNNLVPRLITAVVPLVPGTIAFRNLLATFRKWHESIEKGLDDYQRRLEELRERKIREKLNDPQIKQAEEKINQLKPQVEELRQRVAATKESLADFVNAQLEKGSYAKRLGLMQQVKNDLFNLTQQLSLPSKDSKEEFQQKVNRLKRIFRRGPARVILYIDDLDRCPPERVVEVLEAVQLLVKTPLFIAVLAIDDRYITRALEKVYTGVLNRNGKPSGLDYLEKIIQIPYRVCPVREASLEKYIRTQVELEGEINSRDEKEKNQTIKALPVQVIKFTKCELHIILKCCRYINLSPRSIKRLINIYKIFKIIRFRSNKPALPQNEEQNLKEAIISFLTLSARYPSLLRNVFEEIEAYFEEESALDQNIVSFFFKEQDFINNAYLKREWGKLQHDVKKTMPATLTLEQMGKEAFYTLSSFCFVGDVGYDPADFTYGKS